MPCLDRIVRFNAFTLKEEWKLFFPFCSKTFVKRIHRGIKGSISRNIIITAFKKR